MGTLRKAMLHAACIAVAASGIVDARACGKNHYILDNPVTCQGVLVGSLLAPRFGHTATRLLDGRVLVVGGNGDYQLTQTLDVLPPRPDSVEIYDPATRAWHLAAPLHRARSSHTATLLPDGRVLVVGGETTFHYTQLPGGTAEIYDPVANTWTMTAPMHIELPFSGATATRLRDGTVLVAGGLDLSDLFFPPERYDPAANAWTVVSSSLERFYHSATVLPDGRVLFVAGVGDPLFDSTTGDAVIYDPITGGFLEGAAGAAGRALHQATTLADGRVLVSGGYSSSLIFGAYGRYSTLASAEVFDPLTGEWSPVGDLHMRRYGHSATLLVDGDVLTAGGTASSGAVPNLTYEILAGIELRLGGTGPSVPVGNLAHARRFHTATRLQDGSILIVGGVGVDGTFLASAELIGVPATTP